MMNLEADYKKALDEVKKIQKKYPEIEKILLFGSRARDDHKYNSDIDLCVFAPKEFEDKFFTFAGEIDEINTYYSFDVLFWHYLGSDVLKNEILEDGVKL